MNPHTCISIDDDPLFVRKLEAFIEEIDWLDFIDGYNNSIQGATAMISKSPDILFLDMEMPHAGGAYLMDWLEPKINSMDRKPVVIVVTSLDKEATDNMPNVDGYINKFMLNSSEFLEDELKRILN